MKKGLKTKWGFFLVIVLVFLTGQAVQAEFLCGEPVEGKIVGIYPKSEDIPSSYIIVEVVGNGDETVVEYEFYSIPVDHMEKVLEDCGGLDDAYIRISYHECRNDKQEEQLKACSITIVDCCDNIECTFNMVRPGQVADRIPQTPQNGAGGGYGSREPSN